MHNEWVYNAADIDRSAVVWARYVNPKSNQRLIRYFQGRRIWLFDVGTDDGLAGLRPYTQN